MKVNLQLEVLGISSPGLLHQVTQTCYENTCFCINRTSEVLDRLKERYPMYLVSNFYGNLRTVLHEFNLAHYFQDVIESAEAGYRKPDLELFRIAIEKTGYRPEEIAIIGDSYKNDIQPAIRLGCPSIWLKVKGWNTSTSSFGSATCRVSPFSGNKSPSLETATCRVSPYSDNETEPIIIDDFSCLTTIL